MRWVATVRQVKLLPAHIKQPKRESLFFSSAQKV
jgi:hypothetical protein